MTWRARFGEEFARPASGVQARVLAEVYGAEYPAELSPYSFVSVSELDRFAAEIGVSPGEVLADVGCGRGGPGLWVAANRRARLVGIDIAETALAAARSRAGGADAEFRVGSFEDTGLPDASVHGLMSIDALIFTPDKAAAISELGRVLRPGGRMVLTTWDYVRQPEGRPPQVPDHRPLLEAAGFAVLAYEETDRWRERQIRFAELLLEAAGELAAERDSDPAEVAASVREMRATIDCMSRRVLIVARREPHE